MPEGQVTEVAAASADGARSLSPGPRLNFGVVRSLRSGSAVAGVPCGIGAAWLVSLLAHSHWSVATRAVVGGTGGLVCGVLVAWLFNFVWGKIAAWILARYDRRQKREQKVEAVDA